LAGRITTINAGVLSLTEIAAIREIDLGGPFLADNGLEPLSDVQFWRDLVDHGNRVSAPRDQTFRYFADRGGYPLVHNRPDVPWEALADQLNETVIRRVIQHDLRVGDRGRKRDAALLEEVFRLSCRYAGQCPSLKTLVEQIRNSLHANVGAQRVRHYLRFLAETLLLRLVEPLEIRLKRTRGSPKLCLADHGLRASWLQERIPLVPSDLESSHESLSAVAGRIAESIVGASLFTIAALDIAHLPEQPGEPEIDYVLTIGTRRIPLEVKYQRNVDPHRDTAGIRTFLEKGANNATFGLLVTRTASPAPDPRIVSMPLSTFLLLR
jgi:predicted AAA+ superfamily ATPase